MFAQGSFINPADATPESIALKRAQIAALMPRFGQARYVGEGLGQLATGIGMGVAGRKLDKAEGAGRASAQERFNSILGGGMRGTAQPGGFSVLGSMPPEPVTPPDPNSPQGIANDTMSVLGNFSALEQQHNLPPGYLDRTYMIESGGNPMAQNPNSSAGGPFQFIDSTAAAYGLNNRFDVGESAAAAARLAADNRPILMEVLGREPTAGELYLAHQQGGGGAAKLLANPNARAVDIVGAEAVRLNGGNENMTAAEFANKWVGKFGTPTGPSTGQPTAPSNGAPAQGGGIMNSPQMAAATVPMEALISIISDPWATPEQKAQAQAMLDQQTQMNDPAYRMGLRADELAIQKAERELAAMDQPQTPEVLTERRALAAEAGLQPGTPAYQTFMATGELPGGADNPASVQEYQFYAQQAQARGETPMPYEQFVTLEAAAGNPGNAPELGKLSQDYTYDYNPDGTIKRDANGRPIAVPVPGSPAAMEAEAAAAAKDRRELAKSTEADVIITAAQRARDAAGNREFGSFGSGLVGWAFPQSDSGEVIRQVNTLKSNGTFSALQQMRENSPTGAALGAASDRDLQLLADKAGALDPNSPNIQRDLDDYERTLLRTLYGPEEGDRVFNETRQGALPPPDGDGWQTINGVKVRVKQ